MNRRRQLAAVLLLMLPVVSCGEDASTSTNGATTSDSTTTSTTTSTATSTSTSVDASTTSATVATSTSSTPVASAFEIGFDALPPIVAGMTLREAVAAYGRPIAVQDDFEMMRGYCFHAIPEGHDESVILLLIAPGAVPLTDPLDGIIGRASAYPEMTSPLGTDRIQLGTSAADVRSAYAGHEISESGHAYVEGGHYLDVFPLGGRRDRMIRFETDGSGTVIAIHGGSEDTATLVEGCA